MEHQEAKINSHPPVPSHPLHWFPEFWELRRKRIRPQARLLGLSLLVGIISGVGAVVFFTACQIVSHYALDVVVGYHAGVPGGEPPLLAETARSFHPLLLLVVLTLGGILSGFIVFSFAPEAEGHGTDAAIAATTIMSAISARASRWSNWLPAPSRSARAVRAAAKARSRRLERVSVRSWGLCCASSRGCGVLGGGHGGRDRRDLPGTAGRGPLRRRSPLPLAGVRVRGYHAYRPREHHRLLHFGLAFGWTPLFSLPPKVFDALTFHDPWLWPYLVLALFMVVLAMLYTRTFYGLTYLFHQLSIPPSFKPASGLFSPGWWRSSLLCPRPGERDALRAVLRLWGPSACHDRFPSH